MSRNENGTGLRIIFPVRIIAIGSRSVRTDRQRWQPPMELKVFGSKCAMLTHGWSKLRRTNQSLSLNSAAICIINLSMQQDEQKPHSTIYSQIVGRPSLDSG